MQEYMRSRRDFLGAAALTAATSKLRAAVEFKVAVIGMVHGHVWGHLGTMLKGEHASLVGIAETAPALIAEAKKRGATQVPFFSDYRKMLDEAQPDIVWAFVENNRHLEIVQACAPKKIHVIFEKPLAATYTEALGIRRPRAGASAFRS